MNQHFAAAYPEMPPTTQAAEGLMRRAWTVDEVFALIEAGIIGLDERFELIGGEIVPMSPKGIRHEVVKNELAASIIRNPVTADISIHIESTYFTGKRSFFEPDILLWPKHIRRVDKDNDIPPAELLLAIEVSDSSLGYDLGRKAAFYAGLGIREYWVVNARSLVTTVHRQPGDENYTTITEVSPDAVLEPAFVKGLSLRLAELDI